MYVLEMAVAILAMTDAGFHHGAAAIRVACGAYLAAKLGENE